MSKKKPGKVFRVITADCKELIVLHVTPKARGRWPQKLATRFCHQRAMWSKSTKHTQIKPSME